MMKCRWYGCVAVASAFFACAAPPARAPLAPASPPMIAADEPSALSVASDPPFPADIVAWVRVPAPGRDLPLLSALVGVGSMVDPSELLLRKLGPELSHTVDLQKPADMTIASMGDDPTRILLAVSVGSSDSFIDATKAHYRSVHSAFGRFRIEPKVAPTEGEPLVCELWQAGPPVGPRLLCASDRGLIEQQGPFLLAAARVAADKSNFHAEIPGSMFNAAIRRAEQSKVHEPGEKANPGRAAGRALGEKMVMDSVAEIKAMSWDLTLRHDTVELTQAIRFVHAESLFAMALSGRAGAPEPVPETFWRLPNDSALALYSEGAEPTPMRAIAADWIRRFGEASAEDGESVVPPAILERLEQFLRGIVGRGGAWQLAVGQNLGGAPNTLRDAAERLKRPSLLDAQSLPILSNAQARLGGWALLGLEDDSQAFLEALHDGLKLAADKTALPRKKDAVATEPDRTVYGFDQVALKPADGLDKDALHLLLSRRSNPKYVKRHPQEAPAVPLTIHLLVVADTARHLWLAVARDEALALARVRAVLAPSAASTLGANESLRQLAKDSPSGLGYATIAGWTGLTLSAGSKQAVFDSQHALSTLWSLPKRGQSQIPFWITRTQAGKNERRVDLNVRLQPDAIGDLLQLIIAASADPRAKDQAGEP